MRSLPIRHHRPLFTTINPPVKMTITRSRHNTSYIGEKVRIVEVGARDGLQNESELVPLETKISLITRLKNTGLKHIEAGSFVSPKWVPQMSTTSSILSHLTSSTSSSSSSSTAPLVNAQEKVTYSYLVPNTQGMTAFLSQSPPPPNNEIAIFASASSGFSHKNLNCSVAESLTRLRPVAAAALSRGYMVRGYASMVISCPYSGTTAPSAVGDVVSELLKMGCYEVSLGDTNGSGTPTTIATLLRHLIVERGIPANRLAAHFHDTYGMAITNTLVAMDAGLRVFDSSVGGLGGCPYARGATGNVATEDLVYFLEGTGVRTGVDLEGLVSVGRWICEVVGKSYGSKVGTVLGGRASVTDGGKSPES